MAYEQISVRCILGVESLGHKMCFSRCNQTDIESGYEERILNLTQQLWKWVQRPEIPCLVLQHLSGRDGIQTFLFLHATRRTS